MEQQDIESPEDIQEKAYFLRDYIKENNADSFEATFYDLHITQIEHNGMVHKFKDDKIVNSKKSDSLINCMIFESDGPINEYYTNEFDKLHSSAVACWVDIVTSLAIYGFDPKSRMVHVSSNLSMDCLSTANLG